MSDWKLRDTVGVLVVCGMVLSAATAVDGVAQALIVLVGVVIAVLWIGNFFLHGYMDARDTTASDN